MRVLRHFFVTLLRLLVFTVSAASGAAAAEPHARAAELYSTTGARPPIECTPSDLCVLKPVIEGLTRPLHLTTAPDRPGLLYITEQGGKVRIARQTGELLPVPLLDLSSLVSKGSEQGLLSIAFPPAPAPSTMVLANYTDTAGHTIIARYDLAGPEGPVKGEPEALLKIVQPYSNHNGGLMIFGPDRQLYIGTGDGGARADPHGNGQRLDTLLGKILRMELTPAGKLVPSAGNPFTPPARPEIWAYGLRNPWRFSFDRKSGTLFVADVGQDEIEEVDIVERGANLGWNRFEGSRCFTRPCDASATGAESAMVPPIAEYDHSEGQSITGGFVYRGRRAPRLEGTYIFGDFVSGRTWMLTGSASQGTAGKWKREVLIKKAGNISSFGEDENGELYLIDYAGTVYRFESPR